MSIGERVVERFKSESKLAGRVAARHRFATLDVGRSMFTDSLKIHRYTDTVIITDMTNAGKRGKKVRELSVISGYHNDDLKDRILKQAISSVMHMSYDQAKAKLEAIGDKHPGLFKLSENVLRGIDVEPMGTTFNLEKKFDDGTIVRLTASPNEFRVVNSTVISAPGKPAHGFRQDTSYYSRGKDSGRVFYAWLKENLALAGKMNIQELTKVWDSLGAKWDSH